MDLPEFDPEEAKHAIVTIRTTCPFCNKVQSITVNTQDYRRWKGGLLIQEAFPNLSADDREALMTGICPACFPSDD